MSDATRQLFQVLMCGQPGTLKTYLAARIAHRLGALCMPTVALASVSVDSRDLTSKRMARYRLCMDALRMTAQIGANVVVDGGFATAELKRGVFAAYPNCTKILIECVADRETRMARLRARALDALDAEQASAKSILNEGERILDSELGDEHLTPEDLGCTVVITVDTAAFTVAVSGRIESSLRERVEAAIRRGLDEYRLTTKMQPPTGLVASFQCLATTYDESTEWRLDPTLMAQLQVDLHKVAADVVDIGSGTGLSAKWYADQGHRCIGVDLSPHMSSRAAPRILFTNFGSATDLPFFDASFDLALMRQVLHYTEPAIALREARRVLRTNGALVIASVIVPSEDVRAMWEEFKNITQPLRLRVFSEQSLIDLLVAAGFDVLECRRASVSRDESYACLDHRAKEPIGGWAIFMSRMQRLLATLAPEMAFSARQDRYSYMQSWVTIVASRSIRPAC